VCGACAYGRGMVDQDLIANSVIKAMPDYINATLAFDKSITF
jgi:sulfur relay (sulfurtransferase) complex TusBCD TusD component (DsrE family)